MENNKLGSSQGSRDDSGPYLGLAASLHVVAHEVQKVPPGGEHAARSEDVGQRGRTQSYKKGDGTQQRHSPRTPWSMCASTKYLGTNDRGGEDPTEPGVTRFNFGCSVVPGAVLHGDGSARTSGVGF